MKSQYSQRQTMSMSLFIAVTAGIFMLITLTLLIADFYPEPIFSSSSNETQSPLGVEAPTRISKNEEIVRPVEETALPIRIVIPSISVDTTITSPESTNLDVLDRALQSGAVRYPGSGMLGENTNILIFGHSSYLPVVQNKAYQAFNELGKLTPGTRIIVYADTRIYTYDVVTVRMEKANDVNISFESPDQRLTLATCNTFGAKEDRWVVTARRVYE